MSAEQSGKVYWRTATYFEAGAHAGVQMPQRLDCDGQKCALEPLLKRGQRLAHPAISPACQSPPLNFDVCFFIFGVLWKLPGPRSLFQKMSQQTMVLSGEERIQTWTQFGPIGDQRQQRDGSHDFHYNSQLEPKALKQEAATNEAHCFVWRCNG